jgi:hypothetical protein
MSELIRDEMWDKTSLAVKKVRYFNSLLDQFGGEEGIRTLDTALDRITV